MKFYYVPNLSIYSFLLIKIQHDALQLPLEYNLYFFFRVNWFNQNIPDACALGTPHIGKELVAHEQGVFPICVHNLHRSFIICGGRLMCIKNVIYIHILVEHFHARLLII